MHPLLTRYAMPTKTLFLCRHGERKAPDFVRLSSRGRLQCHTLGRWLRAHKPATGYSCLVSSALARAVETRDILAGYVAPAGVSADREFNETIDQGEATVRRLRDCVGRLMRGRDNVVLVTHSGVIFNLFRLYGVIPCGSPFFPVPLASVYVLRVPFE